MAFFFYNLFKTVHFLFGVITDNLQRQGLTRVTMIAGLLLLKSYNNRWMLTLYFVGGPLVFFRLIVEGEKIVYCYEI